MVTCKIFTHSNVKTIQYECNNCKKPNILSFSGAMIKHSNQKTCWFCFMPHNPVLQSVIGNQIERIRYHFSTINTIVSGIY
jgi:hypothetical protein